MRTAERGIDVYSHNGYHITSEDLVRQEFDGVLIHLPVGLNVIFDEKMRVAEIAQTDLTKRKVLSPLRRDRKLGMWEGHVTSSTTSEGLPVGSMYGEKSDEGRRIAEVINSVKERIQADIIPAETVYINDEAAL